MEHGAGDATAAGVLFERSLRVLGEAEIAVAAIGEDDELLTMTMDEKFVTSVDDSYGQAVGGKNNPPPGIKTCPSAVASFVGMLLIPCLRGKG